MSDPNNSQPKLTTSLGVSLELMFLGLEMLKHKFRRAHPCLAEEEIEKLVIAWYIDKPRSVQETN